MNKWKVGNKSIPSDGEALLTRNVRWRVMDPLTESPTMARGCVRVMRTADVERRGPDVPPASVGPPSPGRDCCSDGAVAAGTPLPHRRRAGGRGGKDRGGGAGLEVRPCRWVVVLLRDWERGQGVPPGAGREAAGGCAAAPGGATGPRTLPREGYELPPWEKRICKPPQPPRIKGGGTKRGT